LFVSISQVIGCEDAAKMTQIVLGKALYSSSPAYCIQHLSCNTDNVVIETEHPISMITCLIEFRFDLCI